VGKENTIKKYGERGGGKRGRMRNYGALISVRRTY
jgi:hypothetical protein